jgi:pre-mRNA-processing factor 19
LTPLTTVRCCLQIWDLRKVACVQDLSVGGKAVTSVAFDCSGSFLAAGGDGVVRYVAASCVVHILCTCLRVACLCVFVRLLAQYHECRLWLWMRSVFGTGDWSSVVSLKDHTAPVTGLRFGRSAASLVSTSMDKTIKVFSK